MLLMKAIVHSDRPMIVTQVCFIAAKQRKALRDVDWIDVVSRKCLEGGNVARKNGRFPHKGNGRFANREKLFCERLPKNRETTVPIYFSQS